MTKGPVRTCAGCRTRRPAGELVRLVAEPGGGLAVDLLRRRSGRGAHLCPTAACIGRALKRAAFGRALRAPVAPLDPADLLARVRAAGRELAADEVRRSWRRGGVAVGRSALARRLRRGELGLLVLAEDAGRAARSALVAAAARSGVPVVELGRRAELGARAASGPVSAVGVVEAGAARRIREALDRFAGDGVGFGRA